MDLHALEKAPGRRTTTCSAAAPPPKNTDDLQVMLEAYLLDKAVYEIGYELNNRPSWVLIPIRGIKHILQPAWNFSPQMNTDETPDKKFSFFNP